MNDPKVVNFPSRRQRRKPEGDAALAANVGKAWRNLKRKVALARAAGLSVVWDGESSIEPRVSRTF